MSPARLRVLRWALWLLLVAAVHGLAVWALPRVIMRGAMSRLVPVNAAVAAATSEAATASGRELVLAPSARGLLLMRVLVADRHREAMTAAQAQRSLHCVAVP